MFQTKNNSNQMIEWKNKILAVKKEKEEKERKKAERIRQLMESGELYNTSVEDAVAFITAQITKKAGYDYILNDEKDGIVTITIYEAFFITADFKLLCSNTSISCVKNPRTGKPCFCDVYEFKDEEEIKKYIEDVRSKLPEGVKLNERMGADKVGIYKDARLYDAEVKIDLNN